VAGAPTTVGVIPLRDDHREWRDDVARRDVQEYPNAEVALAEFGRIIKTLHVLQYCRDPEYRRTIRHLLNRGETRNSLARDVFHGHRGQLRKHYQVGQENQLDTLGIMRLLAGSGGFGRVPAGVRCRPQARVVTFRSRVLRDWSNVGNVGSVQGGFGVG